MTLVRYNPFNNLFDIDREFNKMLEGFGIGPDKNVENVDATQWAPATDFYEDENNFVLQIDLPGIDKKDVKLSYEDGELIISGERKKEDESKKGKYYRVERNYGKFYRAFALPENIIKEDKIEAEHKNGQLLITIPKAEEAKPKQLEIKVK